MIFKNSQKINDESYSMKVVAWSSIHTAIYAFLFIISSNDRQN